MYSKINFRKYYINEQTFYFENLFCISLLTSETIYLENKNKCHTKFFFILRVHKNYTLITKHYVLLIFLQLQFISYMRQINDQHISMLRC